MDQSQGSTSRIPKANLHREYQKILHSLNLTAKAPEDRPVSPKGNDRLFQASIFRCKLVISFLGGDLSTLNNNCHSHILYIYTYYIHTCGVFHCSTKDVFSTSPGSVLLQQSTAQDTGVQEKSFQYLTGLEDESQKGLVSRLKTTHR